MLFAKFKKFITENDLLSGGDRVIAAVSGGADSIILMNLLARLAKSEKFSLEVAHVNYKLRGKDSDKDEKCVRDAAKALVLECHVLTQKPKKGKNLQDEARKIRYVFLQTLAKKRGATVVATAHHMEDQSETVLLHLVRGAGLKGLSGMKPIQKLGDINLIRPLLFASKRDILNYAEKHKIKFRTDATNLTCKYTRNAIRHELIVLLKKYNPNIVETIAKMSNRLSCDDEALESIAKEAFYEALISFDKTGVKLQRQVLICLPEGLRRRIMRTAYERLKGDAADLNSDQLEKIDHIMLSEKKNASYRLPSPFLFERRGDLLCVKQKSCLV